MPENPLSDIIRQRIGAQGAISIEEYMALALQHPQHGYYIRRDPLGAPGDFITAPEISQIFGELIGLWLAEQWRIMGQPTAILAELGPGRGTLMSDALRATKNIPGFHDAICVHLVETSPALKEKQWKTLAGKHPRIEWHESFDTLPQHPLLLIANEFFDALPIRQFIGKEERAIGLDSDNNFIFTVIPEPEGMDSRLRGNDIIEYCTAGERIMRQIAAHIAAHNGTAIVIDYGYVGPKTGDTLQAVREHRFYNVLEEPGTADITAHVDFNALAAAAHNAGAITHGVVSQGAFLNSIGANIRTEQLCAGASPAQKSAMLSSYARLTSAAHMGELFKVMCVTGKAHPTPEGFSC